MPVAYSRSAFFDEIARTLRRDLPAELSEFHTRRFGHLMKIYYDNERVHYEVWADGFRDHIEIGLHFEDGPESTASYLRFFDERIVEIKATTGLTLELERWTKSWGHLFEIHPLQPFDRERARMIGQRMTVLIKTLQPLVFEAAVEPAGHASTGRARYWRRRRR